MSYDDKHTVYNGKTTISVPAALGAIPLFAREGAIIPRGDIIKLNNNWDTNWAPKLRLEFFPSAKTASEFSYFTGDGVQAIKSAATNGGLLIDFGELGANGTVEVHCRKLTQVRMNGKTLRADSDYRFDARSGTLTVPFQGPTHLEVGGAELYFQ